MAIKYEPDYENKCVICDATPTVIIRNEKGETIENTKMCGCCLFGESDCLDPENW